MRTKSLKLPTLHRPKPQGLLGSLFTISDSDDLPLCVILRDAPIVARHWFGVEVEAGQ
ncbi:MAG: hypothetical protein AB3N15_10595 [Paracoccaceae bacterium]